MRLGEAGSELPVVRQNDTYYRLDGLTADIDGAFLAADDLYRASAALDAGELPVFDAPADIRIGAPIARPHGRATHRAELRGARG